MREKLKNNLLLLLNKYVDSDTLKIIDQELKNDLLLLLNTYVDESVTAHL